MWLLLFLCMILGGLANATYFFAASRVRSQGYPVKKFLMPKDVVQVFGLYRTLAPRCNWSLWPAVMYWPMFFSAMAFGILFAALFSAAIRAGTTVPNFLLSPKLIPAILIWLVLVAFLQAVWFTRSILRKVPQKSEGEVTVIRDLWRVTSIREDIILAILGWAGVLIITPVLVWDLLK
jgi:hypothetical protein